jgi:hypothetical protein
LNISVDFYFGLQILVLQHCWSHDVLVFFAGSLRNKREGQQRAHASKDV